MSHGRRFYFPTALHDETVRLSGEEARHAVKVLRIKSGDDVTIMDGRGRERNYRVTAVIKDELVIEEISEILTFPPPALKPFLLLGAPDMKVLDECLLHATELGLFHLALTKVSHSPLSLDFYFKRQERLNKIAVSGMKQSGNPFLPGISFHNNLEEALKILPKTGFLFDKDAPRLVVAGSGIKDDICLCVGPEGDFSPEEKQKLEAAGFKTVSLAPYTLRVETAVLAALSQITSPVVF
jgi:16S rRNA (uracil1498-N3)-methyltransferase